MSLGLMGCNLLGPNLANESIIVGTWEHGVDAIIVLTFYDDGTFTMKKDMFGFNQSGTYSHKITGQAVETYGYLIMDIQLNDGEKMHWEGKTMFFDESTLDFDNTIYSEGWPSTGTYYKI